LLPCCCTFECGWKQKSFNNARLCSHWIHNQQHTNIVRKTRHEQQTLQHNNNYTTKILTSISVVTTTKQKNDSKNIKQCKKPNNKIKQKLQPSGSIISHSPEKKHVSLFHWHTVTEPTEMSQA